MTLDTIAPRRAPVSSTGARRRVLVTLGALVALGVCIVLSLAFGSRPVTIAEVTDGLAAWIQGAVPTGIGELAVQSRLPRTVFGIIAGAALGLSGALMQAVTRNPLADPGILGVNTGAALLVVCGIAFLGISNSFVFLGLALLGASVTAVFVYFVGSVGPGGATPIKLALAGAATTAALSSLVAAILLPRRSAMNDFRYWQVGSLGRVEWDTMAVVVPLILVAGLVGIFCASSLNALALGDEVAAGFGVKVGTTRIVAAAAGVALCAAVTAVAGPIGFVGLMVPHAVRLLCGPDQRWLLPLSAAGGAVLLLLADTLGRIIGYPGEVEAGIITAFLGAPVLILIARTRRMAAL